MKILWQDYETYYDKEYSLKKMTPVEYILDPRFEAIGASFAEGDGEPFWVEGPDIAAYLKGKDDWAVGVHNGLFDHCINAWRFGFTPKLLIDTMSMARGMGYATRQRSVSLEAMAQTLNVGVKGTAVKQAVGVNLAALKASPAFYEEYKDYAKDDAHLCRGIFKGLMAEGFPPRELLAIDMVLRAALTPRFELDRALLHAHLYEVQQHKEQLLQRISFSKDDLMSNEKFAAALRSLGVEPPLKISATTGKEAYAFAKGDAEFAALQEHEDPQVQALIEARLGNKSTLEETRTQAFIRIADLSWPAHAPFDGRMPIPLRYSGAHTHRLSGDWGFNMQNLPRKGALRRALKAAKGYVVITVDASQIEARIVVWLNKAVRLLTAFANKEDVYSVFATEVFNYPVSKATHPDERFVGKQAVLGLGFGMGFAKFIMQLAKDSRLQTGKTIQLSEGEGMRIVGVYRNQMAPEVRDGWKFLDRMLYRMANGSELSEAWGPVVFEHERIRLPNGMCLYYPELRRNNKGEWTYKSGYETKYLFGGKVMENIVQALARICTMEAALRIQTSLARLGEGLALQVHDENAYVVPEEFATVVRHIIETEMRRPPEWGLDLPLDCEVGIGASYGEAK